MNPVSTKLQEAVSAAERFVKSGSVADYEELNQHVHGLNNVAREALQSQWADRFGSIIHKLEDGRQLSSQESAAVEMLIVGDASEYVETENSVQEWQAEMQRFVEGLRRTEASGSFDVKDLLHVQALCRDARGVLPEIGLYLREKERVERCHAALRGSISPEDGRFLAAVIRDLLSSTYR